MSYWNAHQGGEWPPLERDFPEESTVRILDRSETPLPAPRVEYQAPPDDGARLNTPSNHRRKAVDELEGSLEQALGSVRDALAWAGSINYHSDVVDKIGEAQAALNAALGLLGAHE